MSPKTQNFFQIIKQKQCRKSLTVLVMLLSHFFISTAAFALDIGVNIHNETGQNVSDLMKARNFKTARMDLSAGSDVTAIRTQVNRIKANGGSVEVSLQISYQWDNSCNQNLTTVEQNSYNETAAIVDKYKDVIYDYELLNEVTLRNETKSEVPMNSAGTSTAPYSGKTCYKTMTSVLRGMSRAIHDIKASSGYPLRVILGAVGRDFGFLTFMQQQGVIFDVVGYHIYPHSGDASLLSDPWFGAGGALAQLGVFKLPVHINEFDCGEIYDNDYDNQPGSVKTMACFQAFKKHLPSLISQTLINLESVHIYELFDAPSKSGAEGRFGLMYNINAPKVHLNIITAFAGGALSFSEQQSVTSLGILTDAQMTSYRTTSSVNTTALTVNEPRNLRLLP